MPNQWVTVPFKLCPIYTTNEDATEHGTGNIIRRVLHHIREEYRTAANTQGKAPPSSLSLAQFVIAGQPRQQPTLVQPSERPSRTNSSYGSDDDTNKIEGMKPVIMEAIQDVLDELETVYENVAKNAKDHIHAEFDPLFSVKAHLITTTL